MKTIYPKGILLFDQDEKQEFDISVRALDWAFVLLDFDSKLRSMIKYQSDKYDTKQIQMLEMARKELRNCLKNRALSFEMLY
jgi:hypothetical protein